MHEDHNSKRKCIVRFSLNRLERFDEAKDCYESLRSLEENKSADSLLKKLHDIQESDFCH